LLEEDGHPPPIPDLNLKVNLKVNSEIGSGLTFEIVSSSPSSVTSEKNEIQISDEREQPSSSVQQNVFFNGKFS